MKILTIAVQTAEGLHVKPASQLFMTARDFSCRITASCRDCKSILELLGLGAAGGERLVLSFDGPDEEAAERAFRRLTEKSEEFSYI